MRSLADAISIMPVAEQSIEREVLGTFEVLALQVAARQQQREQRRDQHDRSARTPRSRRRATERRCRRLVRAVAVHEAPTARR